MPRPRTDVSNFAPWVDWPKAVARVRKAKTDDVAIDVLKRQFQLALRLFESMTRTDTERSVRRERTATLARDRVESMARAIANAGDHEDWKQFIDQAKALDAALHARKMYEI